MVFSQVISLFLLMLCGVVAVRRRMVNQDGIQVLSQLLLQFSLPCLTLAKLQRTAEPQLVAELVQIFLLGGAAMLLCGGVSWLIFRRMEAGKRAILISMGMFSNAGFMGLPVLMAALGAQAQIDGVIYVAVFNLLCWSVGWLLFPNDGFPWKTLLLNPTLLASLAGILLFATGTMLPEVITNALTWMGETTTPLAMFMVGARLSTLRWEDFKELPLLAACLLRLVVFPLAVFGLLRAMGTPDIVCQTITLCTGMPCAATLVVQAERCKGQVGMAARAVALSTALSMVTIPLLTWLVHG